MMDCVTPPLPVPSCLSPALNISWQTHVGGSQTPAESLLWPSAQDGAGGEKHYQFCFLKCSINNSAQSNRSWLGGGMAGGKRRESHPRSPATD